MSKLFILLYSICFILLIISAIVSLINHESKETFLFTFKLTGAITAIALFWLIQYLYPPSIEKKRTNVLLITSEDRVLDLSPILAVHGSPNADIYENINTFEMPRTKLFRERHDGVTIKPGATSLETLMHLSILRWMALRYMNHWDVDYRQSYSLSMQSGFFPLAGDAKSQPYIIKDFKNDFIDMLGYDASGYSCKAKLPNKCNISWIIPDEGSRQIIIDLPELRVTIEIFYAGSDGIDIRTELGAILTNAVKSKSLRSNHIVLNWKIEYKLFYKFSRRSKLITNWAKSLVRDIHNGYDWDKMKGDIERGFNSQNAKKYLRFI